MDYEGFNKFLETGKVADYLAYKSNEKNMQNTEDSFDEVLDDYNDLNSNMK